MTFHLGQNSIDDKQLQWLGVLGLLILGCGNLTDPEPQRAELPVVASTEAPAESTTDTETVPPDPTCEAKREGVTDGGFESTLAAYRRALPYIVLRAKTLPVIYGTKPRRTGTGKAKRVFDGLTSNGRVRKQIQRIKERYEGDKPFLRQIFLSEGYFFDDRIDVAPSLIKEITLPILFDEPVLYRLRGGDIERLTRDGEEYVDSNGNRAALLLNDRVGTTPSALLPPLHFDVAEVTRQTGARRVIPEVVGTTEASVTLVFPDGEARPALLTISGATTRVTCVGGNPTTLSQVYERADAFWKSHRRIVDAAEQLVHERTMFDEPKDELEDEQEDGDLRLEWMKAYRRGKKKFLVREVEYPVYDRHGNPTPPEVCVDFIFDTWERAFGTWYRGRKEPPGRTEGEVDFTVLEDFSRRYIATVLSYAALRETALERYDFPRRHWVPYEERRRFPRNLAKHSEAIREGDALIIHGLREEDMAEHFHSVLVIATDPLTGIPTLVADNQGRPRLWTLAQAMQPAPKRSIKYRVRVDFEQMRALTRSYRVAKAEADADADTE